VMHDSVATPFLLIQNAGTFLATGAVPVTESRQEVFVMGVEQGKEISL
jgi:hypothetical protein